MGPDMVIVVGRTRWKAAQQLGLEKVPVHIARDLTPAQLKAYRIADNQTSTIAEWNFDLLPIELKDLENLEFDLSLLGFGNDELAKIMNQDLKDGQCDPDDVPLPPDEATTQPGDLWILGGGIVAQRGGSHRIRRALRRDCLHVVAPVGR